MHELSIALTMVEAAQDAASRAGAERVNYLRVQVGAMSGVASAALRFGYDVAVRGTLLEGSELRIEETPLVVFCEHCASEQELPEAHAFRCPVCRGPAAKIISGKELQILDMEIEP
jgi:hydrogenase nickel incorporation protein HypA/HybF